MTQPSIGIIGYGVVGKATARVWMEHADVKVFDIDDNKKTHEFAEVAQCDFVFICVPTPANRDGSCNTDYVGETVERIAGFYKSLLEEVPNVIAIRSTVPIGTTQRLESFYSVPLFHYPEFLTARCSLVDAQTPSRNIVGTTSTTRNSMCETWFRKLLMQRFPGTPVMFAESHETEAAKLVANAFFATKVSFFNEMKNTLEAIGPDHITWENVRNLVLSDGRIAHSHTQVPGPDGKFGFGGSCLPKDLSNLLHQAQQVGTTPVILHAVQTRNILDRGQMV